MWFLEHFAQGFIIRIISKSRSPVTVQHLNFWSDQKKRCPNNANSTRYVNSKLLSQNWKSDFIIFQNGKYNSI